MIQAASMNDDVKKVAQEQATEAYDLFLKFLKYFSYLVMLGLFIVCNKLTVTRIATIKLLKLYQNPFGSMRSSCNNAYVIIKRATPLKPIKSGIVIMLMLYIVLLDISFS